MALGETIKEWNNYCHDELAAQWKFLVFDNDEPLGFITDDFADRLHWDNQYFEKIRQTKTIRLNPNSSNGQTPNVKDCNEALEAFCVQNQYACNLKEGLKPWIRDRMEKVKVDFHPVLSHREDIQGLRIPSPARGVFGIVTAGIHLNAYTATHDQDGKGIVDKIWVAQRSHTTTFPNCFDQIIAGAMDPEDDGSPITTLEREAKEEAMWRVNANGNIFESGLIDFDAIESVGHVKDAGRIYFCMKKGVSAGIKEVGHIEPGVRFCFDLEINKGLQPTPNKENKSIHGFFALTVDEVIRSLQDRQWKPNSGLVMLHFLYRKRLISEEKCKGVEALANLPPLPLPLFDHSA